MFYHTMSFITILNILNYTLYHQDIHSGNILFNHCNSRPKGMSDSGESDTPIIPFHSTFDFRMAFIDFECAVHFESGVETLVRPDMIPPSCNAAPEQLRVGVKYDMFAADVFNLGKTLQIEMQKARKASLQSPLHFTLLKC
jgi:hypothetical protein